MYITKQDNDMDYLGIIELGYHCSVGSTEGQVAGCRPAPGPRDSASSGCAAPPRGLTLFTSHHHKQPFMANTHKTFSLTPI
jgi:hypothetical protein